MRARGSKQNIDIHINLNIKRSRFNGLFKKISKPSLPSWFYFKVVLSLKLAKLLSKKCQNLLMFIGRLILGVIQKLSNDEYGG
jgi:hypothetical protein